MMNRFNYRFATGAMLLASVVAIPAQSQEFEGPNGSKVTFYGQLNLGLQYYDDCQESETNFADSGVSTSRLGFNYDIHTVG
ncbi:MAG: hypothetical protein AAF636_10435 [Pseudomonadota bacterium]